MYSLANANEKTSIAVLKSDIFQVHLRLQKMKKLTKIGQRPQSRKRSEISAIQKGTAEMEEIIRSFPSEDVDKLRYQLVLLLNQKMIELESTVFKITCKQSEISHTPSMSRLPVWLKLLDRYVEMCSPEQMASRVSRPKSGVCTVDTGNTSLKSDLIISQKKIERLSGRVAELEDITVDTRRTLTKEINKLKAELMTSKEFQKELEDKRDH